MNLRRFIDRELNKISDMSTFYQDVTGLPGKIWISSKYSEHKIPRLKYTIDDEQLVISITKDPHVLAPKKFKGIIPTKFKRIVLWIEENYDILIEYWNNSDLSTKKLVESIKKV
ncbi:MAG: hypothetical protein E7071_05390 [Bacteroidales bacterium]|nr:hypothetical protein [Bacteroidales bacterium]